MHQQLRAFGFLKPDRQGINNQPPLLSYSLSTDNFHIVSLIVLGTFTHFRLAKPTAAPAASGLPTSPHHPTNATQSVYTTTTRRQTQTDAHCELRFSSHRSPSSTTNTTHRNTTQHNTYLFTYSSDQEYNRATPLYYYATHSRPLSLEQ